MFIYEVVLIISCVVHFVTCQESPVVNTTSGLYRGFTQDVIDTDGETHKVDIFYGVRYAKPPLGKLRFKHPETPDYNPEEQDATQRAAACLQSNGFYIRDGVSFQLNEQSEDCLHVNIYRPHDVEGASIVVYVYGGSFFSGYNGLFLYDGEQFAAQTNTIYVTLNYRLSLFGFFFLNHTDAPGNAGLFDMLQGLKFIKENAKAIGGDPDKITVWGHSAGAMAVGMMMASPLADGIFTRAILQSGTPPGAVPALALNEIGNGVQILSLFGCYTSNQTLEEQMDHALECLKAIDAEKIMETAKLGLGDNTIVTFMPVVGVDKMLPKYPFQDGKADSGAVKDLMVSSVSNEAGMFVAGIVERLNVYESDGPPSLDDFITMARLVLKVVLKLPLVYSQENVLQYLRDDLSTEDEMRQAMADLFSDLLFDCPMDFYTNEITRKDLNVYRYQWNHRPSNSYWPQWTKATHCDDIPFTTGSFLELGVKAQLSGQASDGLAKMLSVPPTDQEKMLVKRTLKMYGEFIKTGVPVIPEIGMDWPKYSGKDKKVLRVDLDSYHLITGPKSERCNLWADYLTNKEIKLVSRNDIDVKPNNTFKVKQHVPRRSKKVKVRPGNSSVRQAPQIIYPIAVYIIMICARHTM